ncbi:MAG: DNA recombination protein RmuC [Spirochaetaceae bacterium]
MTVDPLLLLSAALLLFLVVLLLLLARRPRNDISREIERVSEAVEQLNRLFLVPRSRGPLGERLLEQALADLLPRSAYERQYAFRDGGRVDAVIRIGELLIPVDSKFPVEAVESVLQGEEEVKKASRAVEKHMQEIARKYIRPGEGTTQFGLMYIPSERIYYELFVRRQEVSGDRRILPVGPGALGLYLQTLTYGMGLIRVNRDAGEQLRLISAAHSSAGALAERFSTMQKHLSNAAAAANQSAVQLERLEQDLAALNGSLEDGEE